MNLMIVNIGFRAMRQCIVVWMLLSGGVPAAWSAASFRADLWMPDGDVNAAVLDEAKSRIFIGGNFENVGPRTGGGAVLGAIDARADTAFPVVEGVVNAVVPDGAGGWYIGGNFTSVGGVARNHIAHILADKTVDAGWDPDANAAVNTMVLSGQTLFIGGAFTQLALTATPPVDRNYIAAVDAGTGLVTSWDPDANAAVNTMVLSGPTLFIGGTFTQLALTATPPKDRNYIAAVDATSGVVADWNPMIAGVANPAVNTMVLNGVALFVGGSFNSVGGVTRNNIAVVNINDGNIATWDPDANAAVNTMVLSGSTLFIGGDFVSIDGQGRNYIASLLLTASGAGNYTTTWNPDANAAVNTMVLSGSTLFIGGAFTRLASTTTPVIRNYIAGVDVVTGLAGPWNANAGSVVNVIAFDGTVFYAGGSFDSIGRVSRNRLASLDIATGEATKWNPDVDNVINTMLLEGGTLYVGGSFSKIDSTSVIPVPVTRNNIAALDVAALAVGGYAKTWDPDVGNAVHTMAISADKATLYIGGDFTTLNGVSEMRNHIAGIDVVTGKASSWDPYSDKIVRSIVPKSDGSTVYVGGDFTLIGSEARSGLAELLLTTGMATSWAPVLNTVSVSDLVLSSDERSFYVADYTAGTTNKGVARVNTAVELDGSVILNWLADADDRVNTIAIDNNEEMLYAGGEFTNFSEIATIPQAHIGAARYNLLDGVDTALNLDVDFPVSQWLFSSDGLSIYAVGSFAIIGGEKRRGLVSFSAPPPVVTASPAGGGYGVDQDVTLTCTDNSGSNVYAVYYTDDSFEPTKSSNEILAPVPVASFSTDIHVAGIKTLKFFCVDNDGNRSEVVTESYIIDNQIPVVTVSLNSGAYGASTSAVRLFCSDDSSGCDKIYYTLDGSVPTTNSTVYSGPILLSRMLSLDTIMLSDLTLADFPSVDTSLVTVPLDTIHLTQMIKDNPTRLSLRSVLESAQKSGWITMEKIFPVSFSLFQSDPGLVVTTLADIHYSEVPLKYKGGVLLNSILLGDLTLADFPNVDTSSVTVSLDSIRLSDLLFSNQEKLSLELNVELAEKSGWVTLDDIPINPQSYQGNGLFGTSLSQILLIEVPGNYLDKNIEFNFIAFDKAGNSSLPGTESYDIDYSPPVITANFESGLYTPPITVEFSCDGGSKSSSSPCDKVYYMTDGRSPVYSGSDGGPRVITTNKDLVEYTVPMVLDRGTFFRIVGVDKLGNVGVAQNFIYAFSEDHRDDTKVGLGSFGPMMLLFILFGLVMRRRRIYINAGSASCR